MRGVPVFAVGVGSRSPLPDLELLSMDAPTFGVVQKPLRIPFVVLPSKRITGPGVVEAACSNVDVVPTLLEQGRQGGVNPSALGVG